MEFIKKYGSYQKNRIYIDNSKLENESINMKEFRKLKGRFYKKTNQWIFPLNLNEKTEPQIIIEEKVSVESQSIEAKMESVTDEEEYIEAEVIVENEEVESVEDIKEEEEIESVEEISIKEEEEIESVEDIKEEMESVEEISMKEEEEVRENKYLCVDELEHTESESDVCSSICVDEVQKFSYIMKPPQELYDTLDDYLKLIDKKKYL